MDYTPNRYESPVTAEWNAKAAEIRPTPQSTLALSDLAKASQEYAAAAETFVTARDHLNQARGRWQEIRDQVSKALEQEGV